MAFMCTSIITVKHKFSSDEVDSCRILLLYADGVLHTTATFLNATYVEHGCCTCHMRINVLALAHYNDTRLVPIKSLVTVHDYKCVLQGSAMINESCHLHNQGDKDRRTQAWVDLRQVTSAIASHLNKTHANKT